MDSPGVFPINIKATVILMKISKEAYLLLLFAKDESK
jgi:hypothetical protein